MKNVFKVAVATIAMVMAVATAGAQTTGTTPTMLEKAGFKPTMPFWSIRTFQARTFSHSVISP